MLRIWFALTVLLKLIVWGVMWVGIYVAVRALIDGEVVLGLVILIIVIPIALFVARVVLGLSLMIVLLPISILLRRRREFIEFSRFQLSVVDELGADRLTLRAGWRLMHEFKKLPPREPGAPAREGDELLALMEDIWEDEQMEADYAATDDESPTEPPRPVLG